MVGLRRSRHSPCLIEGIIIPLLLVACYVGPCISQPSDGPPPPPPPPPPPVSGARAPPPPAISCNETERSALLQGMHELNATGTARLRWPASSCHCSGWTGITCDESSGRVSSIDLFSKMLGGTLPCQWTNLGGLREMKLQDNSITGTLPSCWGNMTSLEDITLDNTALTGALPASWSALRNIRSIGASDNNLSGTLPVEWSALTSMEGLYLSNNKLTGALPASWSALKNITFIWAANNGLNGTLPVEWSALTSMEELWLHNNTLTGALPASWSALRSITDIDASNNSLNGTLPAEWGALTSMEELRLHNNTLTGALPASWSELKNITFISASNNSFVGTLPAEWGALTSMEDLYLSNNSITGSLPIEWSAMSSINVMHLNQNGISGSLPPSWSNLSTLASLGLSSNNISNTLPASWSSLSDIEELFIDGNNVSGNIPSTWSKMTALQQMHMGSNSLSGPLPAFFNNSPRLEKLLLPNNNFDGTLPSSWSALTYLTYLDLSSNHLQETLPVEWSTLVKLTLMDVSNNNLTGLLPLSWTNLQSLYYLGLHQKSGADFNQNLTDLASNHQALRIVSVRGGTAIPDKWCNLDRKENTSQHLFLLYVGEQPMFNYCLEQMCLDPAPGRYPVGWLSEFNAIQTLNIQFVSDYEVGFSDKVEGKVQQAGSASQLTVQLVENQTSTINGWILGSGKDKDPCLDVNARKNVVLAFTLFGVATGLIAILGLLAVIRTPELAPHLPDGLLGTFLSWLLPWAKQLATRWQCFGASSKRKTVRQEGWLVNLKGWLLILKDWLWILILTLWNLRLFILSVIDIVTDIITIHLLWPKYTAFLLIAAVFLSDILAGARFFTCYHSSEEPAQPQQLGRWGEFLKSAHSRLPSLASYLIFPVLLSITIHMHSLLLPLALVFQHISDYKVTFGCIKALSKLSLEKFDVAAGCLDVLKCVNLISLYMALIEAPASLAFTTWGYLAPAKSSVGMYITRNYYFLTALTSMGTILYKLVQVTYHVVEHCYEEYREKCGGDAGMARQEWKGMVWGTVVAGVKDFWVDARALEVKPPVEQTADLPAANADGTSAADVADASRDVEMQRTAEKKLINIEKSWSGDLRRP